ncbi:MAG: HAMP domain-containing histidine kinase [Sulfurimonas sp.]|nr:HAMP domain-containing histidine kinase [Sulfurimonas sp.]PHQ91685.1 MAG: hypothetical protein COB42_03180 [Sulfurimonas sp.]
MLNNEISTLISVSKELSARQEEILLAWVQTQTVVEILEKNNIDLVVFRDTYARGILNYYFGVIKGEKKIDNCPVMDDFLRMLKNHDVSADELFEICTHARKSMISITFDMGIASKELFRDISYIFDLNFKDVLQDYSNTVYRLEKKVKAQIEENKKKDALMFQQGRLAQMGEMISNIAHQWRQPLSMISVIIQNTHLKHSLGKLEDDIFDKNIDEVKKILKQMSQTISDFQHFFEPNKEEEIFNIIESVTNALALIKNDLKKENIEVIRFHNHTEELVLGYPNEFSQALLNIFSNAKDAFVEQGDKLERSIYIETLVKDNKILLTIRDNAGGISQDIIKKVFNPYFTTKEEGKGTGIGLYMTSQIVHNMHGIIYVENCNLPQKNKGVKFTIEFPVC